MDNSNWKLKIISDHFLDIDRIAIEQIPLIDTTQRDALMWMFEDNGCYTVKSGYIAIQTWKNNSQASPSFNNEDTRIWKKIWNLHTIPRHKTILWRILNNSLPLRSELGKRGIHCSPLCPRCDLKIETMDRVFMRCPKIYRIWFGSVLNLKILDQPISNFK